MLQAYILEDSRVFVIKATDAIKTKICIMLKYENDTAKRKKSNVRGSGNLLAMLKNKLRHIKNVKSLCKQILILLRKDQTLSG